MANVDVGANVLYRDSDGQDYTGTVAAVHPPLGGGGGGPETAQIDVDHAGTALRRIAPYSKDPVPGTYRLTTDDAPATPDPAPKASTPRKTADKAGSSTPAPTSPDAAGSATMQSGGIASDEKPVS